MSIDGVDTLAYTNNLGIVTFPNISIGSHKVTITYEGSSIDKDIIVAASTETIELNFEKKATEVTPQTTATKQNNIYLYIIGAIAALVIIWLLVRFITRP